MAEISQWELSKLREHEKEYYNLVEKWNNLCFALKPLISEVILDLDDETLNQLKERMGINND